MKETLTVIVDRDLCEANGLCVSVAPDVFDLTDDDELRIIVETLSDEQVDGARKAVDRCPKGALRIESERDAEREK